MPVSQNSFRWFFSLTLTSSTADLTTRSPSLPDMCFHWAGAIWTRLRRLKREQQRALAPQAARGALRVSLKEVRTGNTLIPGPLLTALSFPFEDQALHTITCISSPEIISSPKFVSNSQDSELLKFYASPDHLMEPLSCRPTTGSLKRRGNPVCLAQGMPALTPQLCFCPMMCSVLFLSIIPHSQFTVPKRFPSHFSIL